MIENEKRNESDKLFVLSFVTNSIVQKTYEELDYHEFILIPTFRISNLLCNIFNVFGQDMARKYAQELSSFIGETFSWNSTDYFSALSVTDATEIGEHVFSFDEMDKFRMLLSLIYIYSCADDDYQQLLDDYHDYENIIFINGIGVKVIQSENKIVLKPLYSIYDSPMNEYKAFLSVLVPPIIRAAVFKTKHDTIFTEDDLITEHASLFFLKLEQLTGQQII